MDDFALGVLTNIGLFSFLALSAYLLLVAGEMSFGQQAFFGIGAYAGGMLTALYGWPLPLAALAAMALGGLAQLLVGLPTLRLRGLTFAMATLAAAEMFRILFELFHWRVERGGELAGPDGTQGFRGIRWIFEHGIEPADYLLLVYALLAAVLALLLWMERSRLGAALRGVGLDPELAASVGIDVRRVKLGVAAAAGALAALGGVLFAHHNTYVEPRNFDIMLGVHSLAYALIGGLGTALGPLLGVALDIGLLESTQYFHGYRMIVFGGLVAVLLVFRPRGLLDERMVTWIRQRFS
ncbi:MAG: branched-chain amino acid ABC transporter permease [Betaproteobacteria bacterium]|nr:branched-chain amino acid ABC transporter permease [Betaproteobacteria bacterium]MDH5352364.1 branched-chain amino acid ABC transporter permease [Betaproteobacteria bacterium]